MSPIRATTYYVIAEALTNVQRHAGARRVEVGATTDGETLLVEVSDDGVGGADPEATASEALQTVEALAGTLRIERPSRAGNPPAGSLPADLSGVSPGPRWIL